MTREDEQRRLRTALMEVVDEVALTRAVGARLAAPAATLPAATLPTAAARAPRLAPGLAFASFAALVLAFGAAGWRGGELFLPDPVLDLALGSVAGVLQ